jgi:hypothetical protein
MSRKYKYYVLAIVLLATFLIKGVVAVAPLFNAHIKPSILQELAMQTESENAKGGAEKTAEAEYSHEHQFAAHLIFPVKTINIKRVVEDMDVRQLYVRSIPTPPPDAQV